jgi:hypothetical protein
MLMPHKLLYSLHHYVVVAAVKENEKNVITFIIREAKGCTK